MRRWIGTLAVVALATAASSARAADPDGGALYANDCAKCHGATGNADTTVGRVMKAASLHDPKLAATDGPAFIVNHVRTDPKHAMVSKDLKDADLTAIATFVQALAAGQ